MCEFKYRNLIINKNIHWKRASSTNADEKGNIGCILLDIGCQRGLS